MNDARIAVGGQALGYMEAIYRMVHAYTHDRVTWGKPVAKHEMMAEKLLDMDVDIKALRSMVYAAGVYQSIIYQCERKLRDGGENLPEAERTSLEKERRKAERRVRRLTPLLKWYGAERCISMARDALQMHGGYGFTKEYRAEFWLRESQILSLYEGTSQIQALMVVKDTFKDIIRRPRRFLENALGLRVQAMRSLDPLTRKLSRLKQLETAATLSILLELLRTNARQNFAHVKDVKPTDFPRIVRELSRGLLKFDDLGPALLHAERLCEIKSLVALAKALVRDGEHAPERRPYAERFMNRALPRIQCLKSEIESDDPVLDRHLRGLPLASDKFASAPTGLHA
jgi:hypothetical protein